jgi:type IV pilus assembly protein PilP
MFVRNTLVFSLLVLAGCESSNDENLSVWMATVRQSIHINALTVPPPLLATPAMYEPANRADPFDATKISMLLDMSEQAGVRPDLKRSREPLESYPLDQFRLVGSLGRQGQSVALVEVGKMLYQIHKGDHIGQDLGEVIAIREGAVDIEETLQEANGVWIKRRVQLSMREAK